MPLRSASWRMLGMRGSRVDYQIRVPLRSAVRVLSRSGRVDIAQVEGRVHSEALSGRLAIASGRVGSGRFDHQEALKQYEGKKVRIKGSLDPDGKTIHIK